MITRGSLDPGSHISFMGLYYIPISLPVSTLYSNLNIGIALIEDLCLTPVFCIEPAIVHHEAIIDIVQRRIVNIEIIFKLYFYYRLHQSAYKLFRKKFVKSYFGHAFLNGAQSRKNPQRSFCSLHV